MSIGVILIIILVLLLVGGLPNFGYHSYGYGPSGAFGVLIIVLVVLLVMGRI
jgi:hypothetical protein